MDERGLYLQVPFKIIKGKVTKEAGGASWILRYEISVTPVPDGKWMQRRGRSEHWMGLGALADFTLKEARDRARNARQKLADGIDPLAQRNATKAATMKAAAKAITFEKAAQACIEHNQKKWTNAKHRAQWPTTLTMYAYPLIGKMLVSDVDVAAVRKVLEQKHSKYPDQQLWEAIPVTADRLRCRIKDVWDWAKARDFCTGENPARWEGNLDSLLMERGKKTVRHHPALPYSDNPEKGLVGISNFMVALRKQEGIAAQALAFTIYTAARTEETIGAQWDEIDTTEKAWTVPAGRIKGGVEHRVPLTDQALKILKGLPRDNGNSFVFQENGAGLNDKAIRRLMEKMAFKSTTPERLAVPHGCRATFKTWASDQTQFSRAVSEKALAHLVGDETERSYDRGDLFEKRRKLMAAWSTFVSTPPPAKGEVVTPFRKRGV